MAPVKELQKLTRYLRGGVTALAPKKAYPVYAEKGIERFEVISNFCGRPGIADSPGACRLPEGRECNGVRDCRAKGLAAGKSSTKHGTSDRHSKRLEIAKNPTKSRFFLPL